MHIDLNVDGPHSPEYTREVAAACSQAVRVLNHATKPGGLAHPVDVYEVLGSLAGGAANLPQALNQMARWTRSEAEQGRAAENAAYGSHGGDTGAAVADMAEHLRQAADAADALYEHLHAAREALAGMEGRSR